MVECWTGNYSQLWLLICIAASFQRGCGLIWKHRRHWYRLKGYSAVSANWLIMPHWELREINISPITLYPEQKEASSSFSSARPGRTCHTLRICTQHTTTKWILSRSTLILWRQGNPRVSGILLQTPNSQSSVPRPDGRTHILADRQTDARLFIHMHADTLSQIDVTSCMWAVRNKEAMWCGVDGKKKAIILRGALYLGLEPRLWSK